MISTFTILAAAAAAAKSLQSCPTLCDPIEGSPSGSPVPGILQARTLNDVQTMLNIFILLKKTAIFNQPNKTHFEIDTSQFFISREPQFLLSLCTTMEQLTHIPAA